MAVEELITSLDEKKAVCVYEYMEDRTGGWGQSADLRIPCVDCDYARLSTERKIHESFWDNEFGEYEYVYYTMQAVIMKGRPIAFIIRKKINRRFLYHPGETISLDAAFEEKEYVWIVTRKNSKLKAYIEWEISPPSSDPIDDYYDDYSSEEPRIIRREAPIIRDDGLFQKCFHIWNRNHRR